MFKIERKIVEFVERNVNILFILAITGLVYKGFRNFATKTFFLSCTKKRCQRKELVLLYTRYDEISA